MNVRKATASDASELVEVMGILRHQALCCLIQVKEH